MDDLYIIVDAVVPPTYPDWAGVMAAICLMELMTLIYPNGEPYFAYNLVRTGTSISAVHQCSGVHPTAKSTNHLHPDHAFTVGVHTSRSTSMIGIVVREHLWAKRILAVVLAAVRRRRW